LFAAEPTIASACTSGTPAFSIIERPRLNRATAILVASGPKTGSFSLIGSTTRRTCSSLRFLIHQNQAMTPTMTISGRTQNMLFEIATMIWVGSGSSEPRLSNMFSKTGTTKVTIAMTPRIAMMRTISG